jgi:hypothetical protein
VINIAFVLVHDAVDEHGIPATPEGAPVNRTIYDPPVLTYYNTDRGYHQNHLVFPSIQVWVQGETKNYPRKHKNNRWAYRNTLLDIPTAQRNQNPNFQAWIFNALEEHFQSTLGIRIASMEYFIHAASFYTRPTQYVPKNPNPDITDMTVCCHWTSSNGRGCATSPKTTQPIAHGKQ